MSYTHHAGKGSQVFYHGTDIEICLGDRVRIKRWFRKPCDGVVCYIPDISPHVDELEDGNTRQWAISHADGWVTSMIYLPGEVASKTIEFVRRGDVTGWEVKDGEEFH